MKPAKVFYVLNAAIVLIHASVAAADIDMDDPRRALGREGDVRIDAQLVQDTVSPGSPIGITFQVQNMSADAIAIADRVATASYDSDSGTITLAVGSEVPPDGKMPAVSTIAPGEKKLFRAGAMAVMNAAAIRRSMGGAPRFVQVKVTILRDLKPFSALIQRQARGGETLSDELFDRWFEANDTIFLNALPVRYSPRSQAGSFVGADRRDPSGGI